MNIEELVRKKFLDSTGRLTYDELVENFKENFINDEQFKTDFKKAVNRLATVKHEQDRKYLVLKPKYQHNQKKMFPDGLKSSILEALKSDDTTTRQQNVSSTLSDFDLILDSLEFSINNNNAPVVTSPIPEITVTDNSANIEERLTDDSVIASVIQEATEDKSEDVHVQHKVVNTDRNVKASCESIESQSSSSGTAVKRSHSRNRSRLNSSEENVSVNSISLGEDELKWILASALSDLTRIKNLLSKNADLANYVDFTNGYTALHYAAKNGVLVVVQLLMTVGKMDVDRKSGYTALHLATMHGHDAVVGALVDVYGFGFKSHIKSCHSFPTALNSGASCARDNRIGSLRKISFNNYTDGDAVRLRENRLSRHSVVSDKHKSAKM